MLMVEASGLPISVFTTSASPGEVTLVEDTLGSMFGWDYPERLIGDKRPGVLMGVRSGQEGV